METALIYEIKKGNTQAFKQLYNEYFDYAMRVATAITNHTNAADAVQETFIRVYKNIQSYEESKPFRPWFYRILVNECNRYLKKSTKDIPTDIQEDLILPQEDPHPFEEYEDLYDAIQQLEDIHKVPLVLKYLNDFTEQDIATVLELNVNTVKSRLYKARLKLKETILKSKGGIKDGT